MIHFPAHSACPPAHSLKSAGDGLGGTLLAGRLAARAGEGRRGQPGDQVFASGPDPDARHAKRAEAGQRRCFLLRLATASLEEAGRLRLAIDTVQEQVRAQNLTSRLLQLGKFLRITALSAQISCTTAVHWLVLAHSLTLCLVPVARCRGHNSQRSSTRTS